MPNKTLTLVALLLLAVFSHAETANVSRTGASSDARSNEEHDNAVQAIRSSKTLRDLVNFDAEQASRSKRMDAPVQVAIEVKPYLIRLMGVTGQRKVDISNGRATLSYVENSQLVDAKDKSWKLISVSGQCAVMTHQARPTKLCFSLINQEVAQNQVSDKAGPLPPGQNIFPPGAPSGGVNFPATSSAVVIPSLAPPPSAADVK